MLAQAVGSGLELGHLLTLTSFQLHARIFPGPAALRMAVAGYGEGMLEWKVMVTSQRHRGRARWEGGN